MNILKNLLNLLFPKTCYGCQELLVQHEKTLCLKCLHELPFTQHINNQYNEIYKRFYGRLPLQHTSAILYYHKQGIARQIIHHLKYQGAQELGTFFGTFYGNEIATHPVLNTVNEIIPVPLHPKKFRERGYNQVSAFGRALATELQVKCNESLLKRNYYSETQTQKNLFGRTELNHTALFEATYSEQDHGKHFLLVDDVITTGATLEACGKALLKIPNARISIITLAYTQ